jgi:hypothetical protein
MQIKSAISYETTLKLKLDLISKTDGNMKIEGVSLIACVRR